MKVGVAVCVWACVWVGVGVVATQSHKMTHQRQHNHGNRRVQPEPKHNHHVPQRPPGTLHNPKLLSDTQLIHDKEHLKEELPNYIPMDKIQEMSEKEMDYHYFRMHDFDNNLKLDGLEILAAIMHVHDDDNDDDDDGEDKEGQMAGLSEDEQKVLKNFRAKKFEDSVKLYVDMVDEVMKENDRNDDGYLSWTEFLKGRRKDI